MQNSAKIVLQEVIELDTLETLLNGRLKSPHYFGQNSEIDKKKTAMVTSSQVRF